MDTESLLKHAREGVIKIPRPDRDEIEHRVCQLYNEDYIHAITPDYGSYRGSPYVKFILTQGLTAKGEEYLARLEMRGYQ